MKNQLALLVGLVVAAVLLVQMFTFQVRYDEVAVRATFEKAEEGDLITEPGLKFKLPWPAQRVYTYSQQLHLLDGEQTEGLTADNKAIIIKLYLTWKVDDALAFYRTHRTVARAERDLRDRMRDLTNVVPRYAFREFVNTDTDQLKLDEFEQRAADALRSQLEGQDFGISVEHVGVRQILLSESITPTVFEAMRKHQQLLAEEARAQGDAQARAIRQNAQSIADQIMAFAQRRAQAIRDEGNREAAAYYAQFSQDPQFAIFLRQIEALKQILAHNTTFILDANQLWFLRPLVEENVNTR